MHLFDQRIFGFLNLFLLVLRAVLLVQLPLGREFFRS